jgi:hypothetical protein
MNSIERAPDKKPIDIFEILEREGWSVERQSPLELRHEDGSFATKQAAQIIIEYYSREIDNNV